MPHQIYYLLLATPIGAALVTYYAITTYLHGLEIKDVVTAVLTVGIGFFALQELLTRKKI